MKDFEVELSDEEYKRQNTIHNSLLVEDLFSVFHNKRDFNVLFMEQLIKLRAEMDQTEDLRSFIILLDDIKVELFMDGLKQHYGIIIEDHMYYDTTKKLVINIK